MWFISAYVHRDTSDGITWYPKASHRSPAIHQYMEELRALPGFTRSQYIEIKGQRVLVRLSADNTTEAQDLLSQIQSDPYITRIPANLINTPLAQLSDVERGQILEQLEGGWKTDPSDPNEMVWDPAAGYDLERIDTRLQLQTNLTRSEIRTAIGAWDLLEILRFLRENVDIPLWDGTKIVTIGEKESPQTESLLRDD